MRNKISIALIFKKFLKNYPKQFFLLFALLLTEAVIAVLAVLTIAPLADFVMDPSLSRPGQITQFVSVRLAGFGWPVNFWMFGGLFVVTNLVKGIVEVTINFLILQIKYRVVGGLTAEVLHIFFKARWQFFSNANQGQLINSMNRELDSVSNTLGALAALFAQIVQLVVYITTPLLINPTLTLIVLGLAILFGLPFMLLYRLSYRLGRSNVETGTMVTGVFVEVFDAARLILGFGRQKQAIERCLSAYYQHARVAIGSQVISVATPKLFQPLGMLAIVIGLGLVVQEQAQIAELAVIMWSLWAAMPALSNIMQGNLNINGFLPSYEQLMLMSDRAKQLEEVSGGRTFVKLESGVEFVDVDFAHAGRSQLLTSIRLRVTKGQMTALLGPSGSGKSTIMDLLLGLEVPARGQILIDDIPLDEWQQNSFRNRVGYVPQDPFLFNTSIRENLSWSSHHASELDLWDALLQAQAADFVRNLPQGIDTIVGARGVRLSGGQRQRIALARALVIKPELLLLDEATSALDTESERLIQDAIEQISTHTATLVIAHRLSTISKADQVYVLEGGTVVEAGSFLKLSGDKSSRLARMLKESSRN